MADRLLQQITSINPTWKDLAETGVRTGITAIKGIGEPQRSYMWEVLFRGNTQMPTNSYNYAKTISIPSSSVEDMPLNYLGETFHFAGKNSSPKTLTITFWDNQSLEVYKGLMDWYYKTCDPVDGTQTYKSKFVQTIEIKLMDITNFRYNGIIKLENAWPTEVSDINLSYDNSDPLEISATFAFDFKHLGGYNEKIPYDITTALGPQANSMLNAGYNTLKSML